MEPDNGQSILLNEKYKGDALLQKKFTVDFLTKKQKVNEGEVPQYYVEDRFWQLSFRLSMPPTHRRMSFFS